MRKLCLLLACLPLLAAPPKVRRNYLRIPVFINGQNGDTAALTTRDFTVKLDGQPARILALRGPADDLMVLLVLDLTEDLGLVEIAKEALGSAPQSLPGNAQVALLRAQDGLRVLLDPTTDRAALTQAIQAQPVSGKAGLLDTLQTAARLADSILSKAAVRLVLLYVTDSNIYNYRADYINPVINSSDYHDLSRYFPEGLVRDKISKLESKLAGFEAPLFIVHLSYRSDRLNEAYQTGLLQLAAATGGASVFCRSRAEIPEAIANAFRTIASHYSLDLQLPEHISKVVPVQLESGGRALTYRSRFVFQEK